MSHASKCDCAITMRKKDVQIQKMEKKMAKLRKQRDIAESRLEDFMRMIEHHHQALKSGTPYFGNHTDKWKDDGSVSDTSGVVNLLDTRSFISDDDDDDDDDINEELPMRSQDPSDEYCREVQCIEIEETATVFRNNNHEDEKEETKNVVGHSEDHANDETSVVQNVNHRDTMQGAERQEIVFPELELGSSVLRSDSMSSSYGSNSTGIPTPLGEEGGISTFQTFVDGLKEMSKRHQEVSNAEASSKMERDLGVDGDFERKRQEILELWQSCNVSLVRRTYFHLLLKGDEADSVYIGVELRRLLFIKDRFSQGKQASDGGETLTLSSSLKALHKERKMLSKLVRKRFSEEEMTRIYHKFGIAVNSKRRRLQLVNKLWSNPKDMTQVAESADVVSKLVKLTEQGKTMKEMFVFWLHTEIKTNGDHHILALAEEDGKDTHVCRPRREDTGYDRVYGGECPTRQVYEDGTKEIALSVVKGINCSIFAYGQTSSGKTYTMTAITEFAVADIFDYIFQTVESCACELLGKDNSTTLMASVSFIDLAGSERASQTMSRLKEGCHINQSLLALGTVIRKLSKGRQGGHICTLSPARSHVELTKNTLSFASCAKEVTTKAHINVVMSDKALLKQLQCELARLETELRNATSNCDCAMKKDIQIQKMEKQIEELRIQRDLAQASKDIASVRPHSDDDVLPMRSEDPSDGYYREVQCIEIEESATDYDNNNHKEERAAEPKNVLSRCDNGNGETSVGQNVKLRRLNHIATAPSKSTPPGPERHEIVLPDLENDSSMSSSCGSSSTGVQSIPLREEGGITSIRTFFNGLQEMADLHGAQVSNAEASGTMGRDLGVDEDFEMQRKEIQVLWQTCNVSLVHRTYFYLLFKGDDDADSIYIGVELRRLLFIKDRFSKGHQASEGGESLTLASSRKALHRERKMLSKLVSKRFSEEERTRIYHKFGISVNTKRRRLQLVNELWSNPKDMTHVAESADVVSKLVSFTEQSRVMKEMFGLAFTPPSFLQLRNSIVGEKHAFTFLTICFRH
ncbi:unnamed protein product [Brassica oleracea]